MPPHRPLFWNIQGAWLFYALAAAALVIFGVGMSRHVARWRRGARPPGWRLSGRDLGAVALDGLVGRAIFRGDVAAGIMHALIFWGFAGLFVATVLSGLDHYVVTFLRGRIYLIYSFGADLAGVMLLAGLLWALIRRYVQRVARLERRLDDWLVLVWLLAAALSGFWVEAIRLALSQPTWGSWSFAGWLAAGPLAGLRADTLLYPVSWWIHALLSLSLVAAIPYTKLLHALAAPASLAVAQQPGVLATGAADEPRPLWSQRERIFLDGCTRCGRCVEICPSTRAGEPFSPRGIIVSMRERLRRPAAPAGHVEKASSESGAKPGREPRDELSGDAWYCTTCRACLEVCPVAVATPDAVVELRRQIVERGTEVPPPLTHTLERLFKYQNPWESSKTKRGKWAKGLGITDLSRKAKAAAAPPSVDWCYFVGCTTAIDTRAQRLALALVELWSAAGLSFGTLGKKEPCCGDIARRVGEAGLFQEQAESTLAAFERYGVRRVVTSSPHCAHTMRCDYPLLAGGTGPTREAGGGGQDAAREPAAAAGLEACHYVELLDELVRDGKLRFSSLADRKATFHDPCYLGRHHGIVEPPRRVLAAIGGLTLCEMSHAGRDSLCCGGGGGRMWQEELDAETKMSEVRVREAAATGADLLVTACPLCLIMLEDACKTAGLEQRLEVVDLAELCARQLTAGMGANGADEEES